MKAASLADIKKELSVLDKPKLLELCLRLTKYKKENKELLTYLIFESENETRYIQTIKDEIEHQMNIMNRASVYYTKKSLRKIIRYLDKCVRYSGKKETEVELRIHFCELVKEGKFPLWRSRVLTNMYEGQIKKINKAISGMHEDLQYDYIEQLKSSNLA